MGGGRGCIIGIPCKGALGIIVRNIARMTNHPPIPTPLGFPELGWQR